MKDEVEMNRCSRCNSELVLRYSEVVPFENKYYWSCTASNSCNYVAETYLSRIDSQRGSGKVSVMPNSMLVKKPADIVSDMERHCGLASKHTYASNFDKHELDLLWVNLGFDTKEDFHFWVATQQMICWIILVPAAGSTYRSCFQNLTEKIEIHEKISIRELINDDRTLIELSLLSWTIGLEWQAKGDRQRRKVQLEGERVFREYHFQRNAVKATMNLFNAVRRRDFLAIEALRKKGADPYVKGENGYTCWEFAVAFDDDRLLVALSKDLPE